MKTTSVSVMNLCVPCHCHCRYCLLQWSGQTTGIDYARSEAYARRAHAWMKKNRPETFFSFYFGYSMEHPQLCTVIDFLRSIGSPGGEFLQFDGMAFRSDAELHSLLLDLQAHGIRLIDLTFYGARDYHDRFAGRTGDFDYMLRVLRCANDIGLNVQVGVPLTQENISHANDLTALFSTFDLSRFFFFIPHAEGRGATLDPIRLTQTDLTALNEASRRHFNAALYHTPSQWQALLPTLPVWEQRAVTIALTPQNIDALEQEDFSAAIARVEALDDAYHAAVPSTEALLSRYAQPADQCLYSRRDLSQSLQRRYIRDHALSLYDIHDELQSFVRRF